ncbi:MAG: Bug family tripartite tricarboxylate transporter substrate binding protein, partial [Acidimicrobiia bacterium]
MAIIKRTPVGVALAAGGFAALLTLTLAPIARAQTTDLAWVPERPVEFVITTSPGGGSDLYARFITSVVYKLDLWDQPLLPANHPGGSGAVAFNYLFGKKGDPHYIMITLNSIITTPLIQEDLPFTYEDFTPISLLALDPFFLWVPADSPIKSVDDFLAEAKSRSMNV